MTTDEKEVAMRNSPPATAARPPARMTSALETDTETFPATPRYHSFLGNMNENGQS